MSGSETTQAIRAEFPDARIVVISTYVCDEEIYSALQSGAMAYLVEVRAARGADARHPEGGRRPAAHPAGGRRPAGGRVSRSQLSTRELDVLRLLVGGRRNREIAPVARHHRGHGQAAREQHPGEARRGGPDRGRDRRPPAGNCPARMPKLHDPARLGPWLKMMSSVGLNSESPVPGTALSTDLQHPQHLSTCTPAPEHLSL